MCPQSKKNDREIKTGEDIECAREIKGAENHHCGLC